MRDDPYELIEGLMIAAFVVSADEAFIYLKTQLRARAER